jgi:hypothetical protein
MFKPSIQGEFMKKIVVLAIALLASIPAISVANWGAQSGGYNRMSSNTMPTASGYNTGLNRAGYANQSGYSNQYNNGYTNRMNGMGSNYNNPAMQQRMLGNQPANAVNPAMNSGYFPR